MGFVLFVLMPAARVLDPEQSARLTQAVRGKFRWIIWGAIVLLIGSGIYNLGLVWEAPWGRYWQFLTAKIALSIAVFLIALALTVPLRVLEPFRARRKLWLTVAFVVALVVILISAYLRRG